MSSRVRRRSAGVVVVVLTVGAGVLTSAWTLGLLGDTAPAMPLVLQLLLVLFVLEATRTFVHIVVGSTFYEPTRVPEQRREPLVSVVIPAWNEEVGLGRTIESVLASDYSNLEIVIVDDGSDDNTGQIARRYVEQHPSRLFLVRQRNGGKASALNRGVQHALGEIVVNVDSDSIVLPNAISNLVQPILVAGADAVVGRVEIGNPQGFVRYAQNLEYALGFHLRRTQSVMNTLYLLSGAMCAYRREAFDRTAGFRHGTKTEDLEFSLQLRNAGARVVSADDAVCITEGAPDLRGLLNQRTRWRLGGVRCLVAHRHLLFDRRPGRRLLGWYELPATVLAFLQVLVFPAVIVGVVALPIYTGMYAFLLLILIAIPLNAAVAFWGNGTLRRRLRDLPVIAPVLIAVTLVETAAMWSAVVQLVAGLDNGWTEWRRRGVGQEPTRDPESRLAEVEQLPVGAPRPERHVAA